MTPEWAVLISTLVAGIFSVSGVVYTSRKNTVNSTFETLVKAYQAVGEENSRLRDEVSEVRKENGELRKQLADCYRTK